LCFYVVLDGLRGSGTSNIEFIIEFSKIEIEIACVLVVIDELLHWGSTRCYMARSVADAASLKKRAKDKDFDDMTVTTAAPAEDSKSVVGFSSKDLGRFGPNPFGSVGDDSSSVASSGGSQPDVQHKDGMESHTSSNRAYLLSVV
jgi:hypothetical protein